MRILAIRILPMRILAGLCAIALWFGAGIASADAKKVLRVATQLPLKSTLGQNLLLFKDEVEKATGGALELQLFDSGQLFDDSHLPDAIGSGAIDIGMVSLTQYAERLPAVDLFYIPFLFGSDSKLQAAIIRGSPVRGPLDEAISTTGARVLWWQPYGGTIMLSRGAPIKSPAELKGRKVRTFARLLADWVKANAGTAIAVPGSEQYFAYQRGTVDIGTTNPDAIRARKLWEVMDSVTVVNLASIEYVVAINARAFDGLSDDEKAAVDNAAMHAEAKLHSEFVQIEREALEAARQKKMTLYAPNAAEVAAFRKSADPVRDAFLKSAGELGKRVYNAAMALK